MPGGRLSDQDRRLIASGLAEGLGDAEMARRLGRPTSTVSREVARNGGPDGYRADHAHEATGWRARRHRQAPPAEPPVPIGADGRDPEAVRAYVEQFAALMVQTGLPRTAARVLAALYTTDAGVLRRAARPAHHDTAGGPRSPPVGGRCPRKAASSTLSGPASRRGNQGGAPCDDSPSPACSSRACRAARPRRRPRRGRGPRRPRPPVRPRSSRSPGTRGA
ncbi:helix-turn-helix domain-containing protein [Sorangium sp. So ce134]